MSTKENGRLIVEGLVQKFSMNLAEYKKSSYNETMVRTDFINPLLTALGWDVHNNKNKKQHLREVVEEDTVDVEDEGRIKKKKPDYALKIDGKRKLFIEVKKPKVQIETDEGSVFQARRYGWSAKLPISILTNFESIVIYDCRYMPKTGDHVSVARIKTYKFDEFLGKFDELYDEFSYDAVRLGSLEKKYNLDTKINGTQTFDKHFLEQIEGWRLALSENLIQLNSFLKSEDLNFLVQRFINRVVFLRICEDRELEKYRGLLEINSYKELKSLFEKADKKYNSGLFNFIEDELSFNVEIDSNIIINIFQEIYYPQSPYTFSVVESNVLGEIYELFLAREVSVNDDFSIEIIEKPEVVESAGVVTTPKYIVDSIVEKTISPIIGNKEPKEISKIRIADISCGSGVFLLGVYENLLNYHMHWYIKNSPEKFPDKIYQKSNGEWKLTLFEKHRILSNNIFGVDIDSQAVEIARFSLLLKVLEDESDKEIEYLMVHNKLKALPNINGNILCGNSLIDYLIYGTNSGVEINEEDLIRINPFNWETEFKSIFENGGFDAVVGNPPYIKIQNIIKYSEEKNFYRKLKEGYRSAQKGNFDKYALFIERGLDLLKPNGMLGYIVPNKFFIAKYGEALRGIITDNKHLMEVVHFNDEQVFKNRLTYTCLLILSKQEQQEFLVEHVSDLIQWQYGKRLPVQTYNSNGFSSKPWVFWPPKIKQVFDKISMKKEPIKNYYEIFVGIQTSKDDVYVISPESESEHYVEFTKCGEKYSIERNALRPMLMDEKLMCFTQPEHNAYLIYPYKSVDCGRAIPYTQEELKNKFPYCYNYLQNHKEVLLGRSVQGFTEDSWFRFGRSQSLAKFDGQEKLIWPVLSKEPKYTYDEKNIMFSGGGNGPYYGMRRKSESYSLYYILAILSHPAIETMIKSGITSKFKGGYYSHGKQFVENLPFKSINFEDLKEVYHYDNILIKTEKLIGINKQIDSSLNPRKKELLIRQSEIVREQLNSHVEELYCINEQDMEIIRDLILN